jgi:biopolymer transport protein TolR
MVMLTKPGGGRRNRRRAMADINVTPFVDVMLVLLIVFMITAPMLVTGVQVDMPKVKAGVLPDTDSQPLMVTIDKKGDIYIGSNEKATAAAELAPQLKAIAGENLERRVYIRGDDGAAYGRVVGVAALLKEAGFTGAALLTDSQAVNAMKEQ